MSELKDDSTAVDLHTEIDKMGHNPSTGQVESVTEHSQFGGDHAQRLWDNLHTDTDDIDFEDNTRAILASHKLPVDVHHQAMQADSIYGSRGQYAAMSHPEVDKEALKARMEDMPSWRKLGMVEKRNDISFDEILSDFGIDDDDITPENVAKTLLESKQVSTEEIDKILNHFISHPDHDLDDTDFHDSLVAQESLSSDQINKVLDNSKALWHSDKKSYFDHVNADPLLSSQHVHSEDSYIRGAALASKSLPRSTIDSVLNGLTSDSDFSSAIAGNPQLTSEDLMRLQNLNIAIDLKHPSVSDVNLQHVWDEARDTGTERSIRRLLHENVNTPASMLKEIVDHGFGGALIHPNANMSVVEAGLSEPEGSPIHKQAMKHPLVAEQQASIGLRTGSVHPVDFLIKNNTKNDWPAEAYTKENMNIAVDQVGKALGSEEQGSKRRKMARSLGDVCESPNTNPETKSRAISILQENIINESKDDVGEGFSELMNLASQSDEAMDALLSQSKSIVRVRDYEHFQNLPSRAVDHMVKEYSESESEETALALALSGNSSPQVFIEALQGEVSQAKNSLGGKDYDEAITHPHHGNLLDGRLKDSSDSEKKEFFDKILSLDIETHPSGDMVKTMGDAILGSGNLTGEQLSIAVDKFATSEMLSEMNHRNKVQFMAKMEKNPEVMQQFTESLPGGIFALGNISKNTSKESMHSTISSLISQDPDLAVGKILSTNRLNRQSLGEIKGFGGVMESAVRENHETLSDKNMSTITALYGPLVKNNIHPNLEKMQDLGEFYVDLESAMVRDWDSYAKKMEPTYAKSLLESIADPEKKESLRSSLMLKGSESTARSLLDTSDSDNVTTFLQGHMANSLYKDMDENMDLVGLVADSDSRSSLLTGDANGIAEAYTQRVMNYSSPNHPTTLSKITEQYLNPSNNSEVFEDYGNVVVDIGRTLSEYDGEHDYEEYYQAAKRANQLPKEDQYFFFGKIADNHDSDVISNEAFAEIAKHSPTHLQYYARRVRLTPENKELVKKSLQDMQSVLNLMDSDVLNFNTMSDVSFLYHQGLSLARSQEQRDYIVDDLTRNKWRTMNSTEGSDLLTSMYNDETLDISNEARLRLGRRILSSDSVSKDLQKKVFWSGGFSADDISSTKLSPAVINDVGAYDEASYTQLKMIFQRNNIKDLSAPAAEKLMKSFQPESFDQDMLENLSRVFAVKGIGDNPAKAADMSNLILGKALINDDHSMTKVQNDILEQLYDKPVASLAVISGWNDGNPDLIPTLLVTEGRDTVQGIINHNFQPGNKLNKQQFEKFTHQLLDMGEKDPLNREKILEDLLTSNNFSDRGSYSEDFSKRLMAQIVNTINTPTEGKVAELLNDTGLNRIHLDDNSFSALTSHFPTTWSTIPSSPTFQTKWLNRMDDVTMDVLTDSRGGMSVHTSRLKQHIEREGNRNQESFDAIMGHYDKLINQDRVTESDAATAYHQIFGAVPELVTLDHMAEAGQKIDLSPNQSVLKFGSNMIGSTSDAKIHDLVIGKMLDQDMFTSGILRSGRFNEKNWELLTVAHDVEMNTAHEEGEDPMESGIGAEYYNLLQNKTLSSDQLDWVVENFEDHFDSDDREVLASHPGLSKSMAISLAEDDEEKYGNQGSDFGIDMDDEDLNPVFQNPTWGGAALRSLPVAEVISNGGHYHKTIKSTSYSKTGELMDQVLTQIPPEGIAWGQYKKIKGNLSTKPAVKQLFMSAPKQTVTPEQIMQAKGKLGGDFHITYTTWNSDMQTHMEDSEESTGEAHPENMVMQLNLGPNMDQILTDEPKTKAFYQAIMDVARTSSHPVTPQTVSWARIDTADADNWIVEELQSDFDKSLQSQVKHIKEQNPNGTTIGGVFFTPEEMTNAAKKINEVTSGWFEASHKAVEEMARKNNVQNLFMHGPDVRATMSMLTDSKKYPSWLDHMYRKHPESSPDWESVDYTEYPHHSDDLAEKVSRRSKGHSTKCWKKKLT